MLLELEQECLEAYRRKVDQASRFQAQLVQTIADSEAELAHICASLGEQSLSMKKKELASILQQLETMQKKKSERKLQFTEILDQIHNMLKELSMEDKSCMPVIDESDLSLRRLEEFKTTLHALEKEKSDRLKQVLGYLKTLHTLCVVLGMDFRNTISGIHPTLDNSGSKKSISTDTIERLSNAVCRLNEVKIQRLQRVSALGSLKILFPLFSTTSLSFIFCNCFQLQDLATTMVELWNLMDISNEEQQPFQHVTSYIAASENERADLEQLCRQAHIPVVMHGAIDFSAETLESVFSRLIYRMASLSLTGDIDPLYLLEQVEFQISKAKEEASSRKDILEKIDKWLAACTHLLLKRAERARILVDKIPAMVETLREKALAWEQNSGVAFSYDGVLLPSMLDDYDHLKHEKDQERQRMRDQKKLQGQLIAEQEVRFGSKPSPFKSGKRVVKAPSGGSNDRRNSVAGAMLKTPKHNQTALSSNVSNLHNRYHNSIHAKIPAASARKPLSPVSSSLSSNANVTSVNTHDRNPTLQKTLLINKATMAAATPKTFISSVDHEDHLRTPKTMIPSMPSTPATTSMKMAMTPSTPFVPRGADGVDYSFEEIRAGWFPAKS
ncbi:Microtubule-associated protein, MAP65/Ase1/PRC1, partial [Cynara cardunculus var. scolymus]